MTFQTIDTGRMVELLDINIRRGEVIRHDTNVLIKFYKCSTDLMTDSACDFDFYTFRDLQSGRFMVAESLDVLQ